MPPIEFYGSRATVAHLGKMQYLKVRCGFRFCRHIGAAVPGTWPQRIPITTKLCDLPGLLRCSKCGRKSRDTRVCRPEAIGRRPRRLIWGTLIRRPPELLLHFAITASPVARTGGLFGGQGKGLPE